MTPTATITGNNSGNSQTIKICNITVWDVGSGNNATGPQAYPPNATQPIELVDFSGAAEPDGVRIGWITATEHDNDHFTVERSANGVDFAAVALVDGAGNSGQTLVYMIFDLDPERGVNYYRLKQTDTDGTFTYSNTIAVLYGAGDGWIFPNPLVEGVLTLNLPGSGGSPVQLKVIDARGSVVLEKIQTTDEQGRLLITRDELGAAPPGSYVIMMQAGASRLALPLILQ